jgi:transcriptional regulator with XRE-family HTH domain
MHPLYPNRLRELRGRRFTQEELAELIQVNPSTYRSWEDGSHRPRPRHVRALCKQLGVEEHELGYGNHSTKGSRDHPFSEINSDLPPAVRRSQDQWYEIRKYLGHHWTELVKRAADLYRDYPFIGSGNAFTHPDWVLAHPLSLEIDLIRMTWLQNAKPSLVNGSEPEARLGLPLHSPGHLYDRYSTAVRYLDRPWLFENRLSYRLIALKRDEDQLELSFGLGCYFDKIDVSETLAHEFAAVYRANEKAGPLTPAREDLPFRALVGQPFDLSRRPVMPGIMTLTLRQSGAARPPAMFLHHRDPSRVAIGPGVHTVIPSGEFQPASIAPESCPSDLDLWRNIVREYSEELLDTPEHDGSHGVPLDYEAWPFYRLLSRARHERKLRVLFLGAVCNPLSLNIDLLTVAIFDDETFDAAFPAVSGSNSEGRIVTRWPGKSAMGLNFDDDTVEEFLAEHRLGPSSEACLALAWKHRSEILA